MPTHPRFTHPSARAAVLFAVLGTLPLSLVACGSSTPSPTTSSSVATSDAPASGPATSAPADGATSASPSATGADSPSTGTAAATFGSGCSKIPTTGKGSFDGMSADGVATAASNNPLLSTLVTAVKRAGLVDTLNNTQDITVFAPDNDAFSALGKTTLTKALADKSRLTKILTTHVVKGRIAPADLAGTHKTLSGSSITITGSGDDFTVDKNAHIVCGNVQTANATVYIIDHVLTPS